MQFTPTNIHECWLCEPTVFEDDRGYFYEAFNKRDFFIETDLDVNFVQQNQSKSSYGVWRGLHLQKGDHAQAKYIRVIQGEVLDVVFDLRQDSPTFKQLLTVHLSAANKKQLFVPRGCAHGFLVLQDETIFTYSCDNFYKKEAEITLHYTDPEVGLQLPIEDQQLILSEKDIAGDNLDEVLNTMYG